MRRFILSAVVVVAGICGASALAQPPAQGVPASRVKIQSLGTDLETAVDSGLIGAQEPLDIDGNGRFERHELFDADGDGSVYTTCVGKDDPFPQCKIAGQVIYPDTADDLNVMIRDFMEPNGTITLRGGWHVVFPCWDVGGYLAGDPGVADPEDYTTRDNTNDPAFADCPLSRDGRPALAVSLGGWKGTIVGIGSSLARPDTATASVSTYNDTTWISVDTGNQSDSWFNIANLRPIIFGYPNDLANAAMAGSASYLGTGGGGYGLVRVASSPKDIRDLVDNTNNHVSMCVCATDGGANCAAGTSATIATYLGGPSFDIQSITTKTPLLLEGPFSSLSTKSAVVFLRPEHDGPFVQGGCATAQEVELHLMIAEEDLATPTYPDNIYLPAPWKELVNNNTWVSIVRDDYLDSAAQIRDVTFTGNDWVGEDGGDCTHTPGLLPAGFTLTDHNCDSGHMTGLSGYQSRTALVNVAYEHNHGFAVDGEIFPPTPQPIWDGVTFRYCNGNAVSDPGFGWKIKNTRVQDCWFSSDVFSNFGLYRQVDNLEIEASSFLQITTFSNEWWDVWRDVRLRSNAFVVGFAFQCGSKFNRIENVHSSGRLSTRSGAIYGLVDFQCDPGASVEALEVMEGNTLLGLIEDPPGDSRIVTGSEPGNGGGQVLITTRIPDDADFAVMGHNTVMRSQCLNDRVPTAFGGAPNTTEECAFIGVSDSDDAGSDIDNEVEYLTRFLLVGNMVRGSLFAWWGYEGFYSTIPDPTAASSAAVNQAFARYRANARLNNTVIEDTLTAFPVNDNDAVVMLASSARTCDATCAVGGMVCDAGSVAATNVTVAGAAGDEITSTTCGAATGAEDYKLCPCRRSAAP